MVTTTPSLARIAIALALIVTWLSLFLSSQALPYNEQEISDYLESPQTLRVPIVGKAGFPFTVFYFPPPPMGNDIPPDGSFFPFALNTMIYFLVMLFILTYLPKRFITVALERGAIYFAFIVCFIGLFWTILKFD